MTAAPSAPTADARVRHRHTAIDPRSFVFWVLLALVVYGGVRTFKGLADAPLIQLHPAVGWYALAIWFAYGAAFLLFVYYHQLFERRSATVILAALLWGGLVAAWFASSANGALLDLIQRVTGPDFADKWAPALSGPINEETLKLLGLVALALLPLAGVRSTLDGWFYGMMIGLGFEVVENYVFTVSQSGSFVDATGFLLTRGLLGGLWSHAVYTGIAGAGIGYLVSRRDRSLPRRLGVAIGLFLVAWVAHFVWNAPFLSDWAGQSPGAQIVVILIKGVPAFVLLLLVIRWGRNQARQVFTRFVGSDIDPALVSEPEATALLDKRSRRQARKSVARTKGRHAGRLQKKLQREQLGYIQSVSEEGPGSTDALALAKDVLELKALIARS